MKLPFGPLCTTTLAVALASCQTVTSIDAPVTMPPPEKPRVGLYYFLPRKSIQLTGEIVENAAYKITLTEHLRADRKYRYFLRQEKNVLFDDNTTLGTDDIGLLSTVDISTTDQTGAVLSAITETILNVAKIAAQGPKFFTEGRDTPINPFDVTFDPLDDTEFEKAKEVVGRAGFTLQRDPPLAPRKRFEEPRDADNPVTRSGVLYRPPNVVAFSIEPTTASMAYVYRRFAVTVPDWRTVEVLPFNREIFVNKKLKATFASGLLKEVKYEVPSQLLGAVKIPATIVKQVADALPSLIEVRNANRPSPTAAIEAETARLNAETALINAKKANEAAKK